MANSPAYRAVLKARRAAYSKAHPDMCMQGSQSVDAHCPNKRSPGHTYCDFHLDAMAERWRKFHPGSKPRGPYKNRQPATAPTAPVRPIGQGATIALCPDCFRSAHRGPCF